MNASLEKEQLNHEFYSLFMQNFLFGFFTMKFLSLVYLVHEIIKDTERENTLGGRNFLWDGVDVFKTGNLF